MLSNPLVSIVVPVYMVEKYLERCLDSIVAQTYRPIEVILVNDGSSDGSGEIIRRYENTWPFIHSIWQENRGVSVARNAGISIATGIYLALVDSDDYIEHDFISSMVAIALEKNAEVVICNFYIDFPNNIKIRFPLMTLHKNLSGDEAAQISLSLLRLPVFAWNKLYLRKLFIDNDIIFPSIYYEDIATASKLLIKAHNVAITQKPYYHYCRRSTGITGNFGIKNITDYIKAVDIVRHFIWNENLWDPWSKQYSNFLRIAEIQLILEVTMLKNTIPFKDRRHMIRLIHNRIKGLKIPPDKANMDLIDL
ncbi:MAG: glycosyltransferase [Saccharofermentanales bacterium]